MRGLRDIIRQNQEAARRGVVPIPGAVGTEPAPRPGPDRDEEPPDPFDPDYWEDPANG